MELQGEKNNQPTNYPVSVGGRTFTQVTPPKQNWVSNGDQTLGQNARNTKQQHTHTPK